MSINQRAFAVLFGLVAIVGGLLGWQWRAANRVREAIVRYHTDAIEYDRLSADHRRLLARQVSPAELERLRADRIAVSKMLNEIEAMKRRTVTMAQATVVRNSAVREKPPVASLQGEPVAAARWQNAGQASPAAAFQTALWASAAGDLEALTRVLEFDAETRGKASELFAQLPVALRGELGTAERLIALLIAKDIPSGSAQILVQYQSATDEKIAARVVDEAGKPKQLLLSMRAIGDSWHMVVPGKVVESYAVSLRAPAMAR